MSTSWHEMTQTLIKDVREHGKALSGPFLGRNVLILTTTGAKSGAERSTPLVYTWQDGHHVIVASKGGAPTNPSWYHNLKAHPIVTVETGGKTFKAHARVVDEEENERRYRFHADENPGFWDYKKKTSRKIPVIVLEPIEEARTA